MTDAKPFEGITVGLFETRRQREFAAMFAARGAEVVTCPLVFPESHGAEGPVRKFIEEAARGKFAVAIFYTGIGIQAIFDAAEQLGTGEALKEALSRMTLVARGPKSKGALKRHNLAPAFLAEPPTTEGLVTRVEALDVRGKRVAVALAGDHPSPALAEAVERGLKIARQLPGRDLLAQSVGTVKYIGDRDLMLLEQALRFRFDNGCGEARHGASYVATQGAIRRDAGAGNDRRSSRRVTYPTGPAAGRIAG